MSPCRGTLVLLLAVACGTGTSTPNAAPTTVAPTISRARALALVKAGTLHPNDVPGWHAAKAAPDASPSPGELDIDHELTQCLGEAQTSFLADGDPGMAFTKGDAEIGSSVDVAPTPDVARHDLDLLRGQPFADCFEKVFTADFAYQRIVLTGWRQRMFPVRIPGADTVGLAVDFRLTKDEGTAVIPFRLLVAAVGHAEVSLFSAGFNAQPPPVATLTGLLGRSVARVRAVR